MLKTLKKFFAFCGADNRKLFITSIWLGVVSAICSAMRIPAAAIVIQALLTKNVTMATLWISLGIIVVSLIVTIAINMKATMLQTEAGYRACANKRIEIAEHLRYLPMGWFNDNSLGEVTSVTTNTMENMANIATRVVMVTTRGFLTSGIIAVMMFLFDWRMGLITLAGLILFFAVNAAMQRSEQALSQRKFNADERLVSKVLEYVQGIAEVKNFDLTHDSATQVHGAVEDARKASFAMEIPSVLYMLAQFIVNKLTGVAVCTAAIVFYFGGTMELTNCLLMLICSFILFEQLDSAGSFSSLFRSIDIGVDKANAILRTEPMDIDGEELTPEREDIALSHVDFSYDSKPTVPACRQRAIRSAHRHRSPRHSQIVFDEIYGDVLSGKDTAEGFIDLQFRGRANAGHHRRGHITEKQHRIFLLGCQMLCDFDCCYRFAAAGTAPNGEDAASGLLHRLQLLRLRIATKEAAFQEIHSVASLSAEGSAPSLSLDSVPSAVSPLFSGSGSAYSSSIRASCAAMNLAAFSGVPRYTSARCNSLSCSSSASTLACSVVTSSVTVEGSSFSSTTSPVLASYPEEAVTEMTSTYCSSGGMAVSPLP